MNWSKPPSPDLDGIERTPPGLAVRAWAAHEPAIVPVLRDVDEARLETIRSFIAEAGFHGPELTMRAHTFAAYYSMESATLPRRSRQTRLAEIESRVDLILS